MSDGPEPQPPTGFVRSDGRGPFTTHNGPIYHRPIEVGIEQAFYALPRHCNGVGLIHGGMISAFLDGLLAGAAGRHSGATPVTIHLSIDFLGMGRAGEWVTGRAFVTRATRDIIFAEGQVTAGRHTLARATGLFKLMRPRL